MYRWIILLKKKKSAETHSPERWSKLIHSFAHTCPGSSPLSDSIPKGAHSGFSHCPNHSAGAFTHCLVPALRAQATVCPEPVRVWRDPLAPVRIQSPAAQCI